MPFHFVEQRIPEVYLIEPHVFHDSRGLFMETYKRSDFTRANIPDSFVQENHSCSSKNILRGLHYQNEPMAQGKLVRVVQGEVFDVAVDIRKGSPTYGSWVGVKLSAENKRMLYIPPWCAHGFCVLNGDAELIYKTTREYAPAHESGVIWNDPAIDIPWPIQDPVLSERDQCWPQLKDANNKFIYGNA